MGRIDTDSGILEEVINVYNNGNKITTVNFISTCGCLNTSSESIELMPEESREVIFSFDPSDESGEISKYIIIRTSDEDMPKALFKISGYVSGIKKSSTRINDNREDSSGIPVVYFFSAGCGECRKFLDNTIPETEKKLGIDINVDSRDILDPAVYKEFMALLSPEERKHAEIPSMLIGDTMLIGQREIDAKLEMELKNYKGAVRAAGQFSGPNTSALSFIAVLAAGLLDGINPCVFTTLLFLISSLAMAGKKKKEILVIGIFFSSAVFVTYYMVGLGLFSGLRNINLFPVIAASIKWVLVLSLLLIAGMSFYDYLLIRKGKEVEISLQLPRFLKLRIHSAIRRSIRTGTLVYGSLALGFVVSIFELACTGQIYFPTIAYLVKTGSKSAYIMLFVYNISFIFPLVIVFILIFAGTGSVKLTAFFRKNMGLMKVSIALLFLLLAIVIILGIY